MGVVVSSIKQSVTPKKEAEPNWPEWVLQAKEFARQTLEKLQAEKTDTLLNELVTRALLDARYTSQSAHEKLGQLQLAYSAVIQFGSDLVRGPREFAAEQPVHSTSFGPLNSRGTSYELTLYAFKANLKFLQAEITELQSTLGPTKPTEATPPEEAERQPLEPVLKMGNGETKPKPSLVLRKLAEWLVAAGYILQKAAYLLWQRLKKIGQVLQTAAQKIGDLFGQIKFLKLLSKSKKLTNDDGGGDPAVDLKFVKSSHRSSPRIRGALLWGGVLVGIYGVISTFLPFSLEAIMIGATACVFLFMLESYFKSGQPRSLTSGKVEIALEKNNEPKGGLKKHFGSNRILTKDISELANLVMTMRPSVLSSTDKSFRGLAEPNVPAIRIEFQQTATNEILNAVPPNEGAIFCIKVKSDGMNLLPLPAGWAVRDVIVFGRLGGPKAWRQIDRNSVTYNGLGGVSIDLPTGTKEVRYWICEDKNVEAHVASHLAQSNNLLTPRPSANPRSHYFFQAISESQLPEEVKAAIVFSNVANDFWAYSGDKFMATCFRNSGQRFLDVVEGFRAGMCGSMSMYLANQFSLAGVPACLETGPTVDLEHKCIDFDGSYHMAVFVPLQNRKGKTQKFDLTQHSSAVPGFSHFNVGAIKKAELLTNLVAGTPSSAELYQLSRQIGTEMRSKTSELGPTLLRILGRQNGKQKKPLSGEVRRMVAVPGSALEAVKHYAEFLEFTDLVVAFKRTHDPQALVDFLRIANLSGEIGNQLHLRRLEQETSNYGMPQVFTDVLRQKPRRAGSDTLHTALIDGTELSEIQRKSILQNLLALHAEPLENIYKPEIRRGVNSGHKSKDFQSWTIFTPYLNTLEALPLAERVEVLKAGFALVLQTEPGSWPKLSHDGATIYQPLVGLISGLLKGIQKVQPTTSAWRASDVHALVAAALQTWELATALKCDSRAARADLESISLNLICTVLRLCPAYEVGRGLWYAHASLDLGSEALLRLHAAKLFPFANGDESCRLEMGHGLSAAFSEGMLRVFENKNFGEYTYQQFAGYLEHLEKLGIPVNFSNQAATIERCLKLAYARAPRADRQINLPCRNNPVSTLLANLKACELFEFLRSLALFERLGGPSIEALAQSRKPSNEWRLMGRLSRSLYTSNHTDADHQSRTKRIFWTIVNSQRGICFDSPLFALFRQLGFHDGAISAASDAVLNHLSEKERKHFNFLGRSSLLISNLVIDTDLSVAYPALLWGAAHEYPHDNNMFALKWSGILGSFDVNSPEVRAALEREYPELKYDPVFSLLPAAYLFLAGLVYKEGFEEDVTENIPICLDNRSRVPMSRELWSAALSQVKSQERFQVEFSDILARARVRVAKSKDSMPTHKTLLPRYLFSRTGKLLALSATAGEFEEFRPLVDGEDRRAVDWHASAKTDRLLKRKTREQETTDLNLLVDLEWLIEPYSEHQPELANELGGKDKRIEELLYLVLLAKSERVKVNVELLFRGLQQAPDLQGDVDSIIECLDNELYVVNPLCDREGSVYGHDGFPGQNLFWGHEGDYKRGECVVAMFAPKNLAKSQHILAGLKAKGCHVAVMSK